MHIDAINSCGVSDDYINEWIHLAHQYVELFGIQHTTQKPIKEYAEYILTRDMSDQGQSIAKEVLSKSNKKTIAVIDTLVQEWNTQREEIREAEDLLKINEYWRKANLLIRNLE